MRDDDHRLLGRFIESRDENAFQRLVEKHHRLVFSAALRRLGSRELAEEATQNAFTILARKGKSLRHHPALGGWLHRTAMLEASGIARAEKTRQRKHAEHTEEVEIAMKFRDEGRDKLPIRLVDEAIAKLPPKDRDVLILRFYEELSFDEIASRLGQTAAACQKRSGRAVLKLAQHLNRMGLATPTTSAIGIAIASGLASETSGATSLTIAKLAVARSTQIGTAELIRNALLTMSYGKLTISIAITLVLLIPIALEAKKSQSINRELALATQQLAEATSQSSHPEAQSAPAGREHRERYS